MNRKQAGYLRVEKLQRKALDFDLILAVTRGGVILADIIARSFNLEFDIVLIESTGLDEPAIGTVAPGGKVIVPE